MTTGGVLPLTMNFPTCSLKAIYKFKFRLAACTNGTLHSLNEDVKGQDGHMYRALCVPVDSITHRGPFQQYCWLKMWGSTRLVLPHRRENSKKKRHSSTLLHPKASFAMLLFFSYHHHTTVMWPINVTNIDLWFIKLVALKLWIYE